MTSTEIVGRVVYTRFFVTKGGAPYLRVGIETKEATLYTSVWSNERYWELGQKLVRGTTVKARGQVTGDTFKVEPGSWKLS